MQGSEGTVVLTQLDIDWAMLFSVGAATVSALAAAVALTISAYQILRERRSREADLMLAFVAEYKSSEMGEALRRLGHWRDGPTGQRTADDWDAELNRWNAGRIKSEEWAIILDDARRLVKSYFERVARLHRGGYVSKRLARDAADYWGIQVLWDVCEPMERRANPKLYRRWIYDVLRPLPVEYAASSRK